MSGRSCGVARGYSSSSSSSSSSGSSSSMQPLKATVPYQLQRGSALLLGRNEVKTPPKPTIRRTLSLDTIVGPYLQGHWPKEADSMTITCVNDKATQTPSSWAEETRGRRSASGHKRSASWGSGEHLREQILDIPDGHRAPAPVQRCSSGSQSEPSPGPLDPALLSPSQSPSEDCGALCSSSSALPSFALSPPLLQQCSSAPRPNRTYSYQREPPEGCERRGLCLDPSASQDEPLLPPSCPDLNKVNFTPHGGSAFCPVSLLKPLLPSMDLLFRGLSVSPVTGCPGQASPTRHLG
uniref:Uncharacterized protein n=1 Tax=Periophthalmus magnuspinnatus TaxID=409849 RepID=A0A3B4A3T0_9GOBI